MTLCDIVIVGGGAAGLSAALVAGRCRRSVLLCDDGHPRNEASHAVHCLLGNEGMPPIELLAKGRKELHAFGHVALREDKVVSIQPKQTQFTVTCASGFTAVARKVLLTTGLQARCRRLMASKVFTVTPSIIALIATGTKAATNRLLFTEKTIRAPDLR